MFPHKTIFSYACLQQVACVGQEAPGRLSVRGPGRELVLSGPSAALVLPGQFSGARGAQLHTGHYRRDRLGPTDGSLPQPTGHLPPNTSASGLILLIFRVSNCLMTEEALMLVSTMPDSWISSFFS